jgi:hypothetical protein
LRAEVARIADDPDDRVQQLFGDDAAAILEDTSTELSFMRRGRLESTVRLSQWFKEYDVEFVDA